MGFFNSITLILMFSFAAGASVMAESALEKPDQSMENVVKDGNLIIIGASYARGWNPGNIAGLHVVNKGVAGQQTHEILERFDKDVIQNKPRAVLIWGFINDIFRSKPEKLNEKLVQTRENIKKMIALSRQNGIVPILATEVTINTPDTWKEKLLDVFGGILGKENYADGINKHVMEINQWLRLIAAEQNIMILEFERELAGEDHRRKREYTSEDGSHLTHRAYDALTEYINGVTFQL